MTKSLDTEKSGIAIVDTTSLIAVADASLFGAENHKNRHLLLAEHAIIEEQTNDEEIFVQFLHNIILYDQFRTDFHIIEDEKSRYDKPITSLIERIGTAVNFLPIPQTISDEEVALGLIEAFKESVLIDPDIYIGSRFSFPISSTLDPFLERWRRLSSGGVRPYPWRKFPEETGIWAPAKKNESVICALAEEIENFVDFHRHTLIPKFASSYRRFESLHIMENKFNLILVLIRQLSTISRTLKYLSHSHFIHNQEKIPSVYCAMPRRIETIKHYVASEHIHKLQRNTAESIGLFSCLGLPSTGYDFSICRPDIKPLRLSDLNFAVRNLTKQAALDRVLEVRATPEAQELRKIWAERLWSGGSRALEGTSQSISNVNSAGDVVQLVIGHVHMSDAGDEPAVGDIRKKDASDLARFLIRKLTRD